MTFMAVSPALLCRWLVLYRLVMLSAFFLLSLSFCIFQVFMEFSRIVGKNLKQEFYENIDRHSPRFLELFRSKRGNVGQLLTQISQQTNVSSYKLCLVLFFTGFTNIIVPVYSLCNSVYC